jgi:selenocysteine lyase/cysteine desulfurase
MYIPAWPSLNPADFVRSGARETLPFPLSSSANAYFYVARSGIYHLTRALGLHKGGAVLVPDYHHGNEIYALRAAGAKLRFYPVQKNLNADLDAIGNLWSPEVRALYVTHFFGLASAVIRAAELLP